MRTIVINTPGPQGPPGSTVIATTGSFTGSFTGTVNATNVDTSILDFTDENQNIVTSLKLSNSNLELTSGSIQTSEGVLNLSALVNTSSFNNFTSSYNTGSFTGSFTGDGSQLTGIVSSKWSGSNPITRESNVEITGSLKVTSGITGSLFGTASWANKFNETDPIFTAKSASFATTSSNFFNGSQTITGSLTVTQNLTVLGSSSIVYITSSQLDVGTNTISVNVAEPGLRFGGLIVYDSGSLSHQATASLLWDSLNNHWVYQNASGSTYAGGGLISGPKNFGALGNETYPTLNRIVKGEGGDHITDSNISDNGSIVSINSNTEITGSLTQGLEGNIATGEHSHAEGSITKAIGDYSHAEGDNTQAVGNYSHAEGLETIASGSYSHAEGYQTIASANYQHVQGQWNATSSIESAFIVGNGTDDSNRSNLVFAAGNTFQITGSLTVSGSITATSFSGSFSGSGANLSNIPSSAITGLNLSQIATGSIVAAVNVNSASFSVTSGSSTFLFVSSSGTIIAGQRVGSNSDTIRLYRNQNGGSILSMYDYAGSTLLSIGTDNVISTAMAMIVRSAPQPAGIGLSVQSSAAGFPAVNIFARSAQTANLLELKNSSQNILSFFSNDGRLILGASGSTGEMLQVTGDSKIAGSLTVTGSAIVSSSNATQMLVGSNLLFVSSSGRVGIGTTTPTTTFDVIGTARIGNVAAEGTLTVNGDIRLANSSRIGLVAGAGNRQLIDFGNPGLSGITFQTHLTDKPFIFRGDTVEKMRIDSTGNVGIGFASPTAKLQISGSNSDTLLLVGSPTASNAFSVSGSGRIRIGQDVSVTTQNVAVIQNLTPNGGIVIAPSGSGALIAQIPDGTTVGGNARGAYAVDLQRDRTSNTHVASGNKSVILTGDRNTANGNFAAIVAGEACSAGGTPSFVGAGTVLSAVGNGSAVVGGFYNYASGINSSIAGGYGAYAYLYGQRAYAVTSYGGNGIYGDSQTSTIAFKYLVTGSAITELTLNGSAPSSANRAILTLASPGPGSARFWNARIDLSAIVHVSGSGTVSLNDCFAGNYSCAIKRVGSTTSLVGSVVTAAEMFDTSMETSVVTIDADDTNEALRIQFTPPTTAAADTQIRVFATAYLTEVGR